MRRIAGHEPLGQLDWSNGGMELIAELFAAGGERRVGQQKSAVFFDHPQPFGGPVDVDVDDLQRRQPLGTIEEVVRHGWLVAADKWPEAVLRTNYGARLAFPDLGRTERKFGRSLF